MSRADELLKKLVDILADDSVSKRRVKADYREFSKKHSESEAVTLTVAKYVKDQEQKA